MVQENPVVSQEAMKPKSVIAKHFPGLWPYVRLMRANNFCVILTYWPFAWGLMLAANVASLSLAHTVLYLSFFVLANYLFVGAGGTINDVVDVKFDKQVFRCKSRPIAAGELSRTTGIIVFIGLEIASMLLTLPMNKLCLKLVMAAIIPVALYPFSKRIMGFPSFTFGLVVNWGLFIGWASVMNNLDITVCGPLYFGAVCWTVLYDTIYGAQDNKDDAVAGVKSVYLTYGSNTKIILLFSAVGTIAGLILAGMGAGMEWPYYVGMLACSLQLGNQVFKVDLDNPEDCVRKYNEQSIFGLVVFLAMLAGGWNHFQSSAVPVGAWREL